MTYAAPLADMRLVLDAVGGLDADAAEVADAVLGEAAKFAENELAPLNQPGDRIGSVLENGVVRTPPGFRDAYQTYVAGGWNGIACPPEIGGQGLPQALAVPLTEMWNSACMGWALCPLLNHGALEMLQAHGSPELKSRYLDKLVSGEWTGTMNLTEPQAGSDLGGDPLGRRPVAVDDMDIGARRGELAAGPGADAAAAAGHEHRLSREIGHSLPSPKRTAGS